MLSSHDGRDCVAFAGDHYLNLQIFYCGEVVREETVKTCHLYHGEAQLPQGLNEVMDSVVTLCKHAWLGLLVLCAKVKHHLLKRGAVV